jgi:hypothetical protein
MRLAVVGTSHQSPTSSALKARSSKRYGTTGRHGEPNRTVTPGQAVCSGMVTDRLEPLCGAGGIQ